MFCSWWLRWALCVSTCCCWLLVVTLSVKAAQKWTCHNIQEGDAINFRWHHLPRPRIWDPDIFTKNLGPRYIHKESGTQIFIHKKAPNSHLLKGPHLAHYKGPHCHQQRSDRLGHHSASLWKILEMLKDNFLHLKADLVGRVEGWLKLGQL